MDTSAVAVVEQSSTGNSAGGSVTGPCVPFNFYCLFNIHPLWRSHSMRL